MHHAKPTLTTGHRETPHDYQVARKDKDPRSGLMPCARSTPRLAQLERLGNPQAAIRLFCLQCMGGVASEVETCSAARCPLHAHRLTTEF